MATARLTSKQQNTILALLTEPTIKAAAQKAGVGERTVHTWLDEPAFSKAYAKARREATRRAVARLQQYSDTAAAVLLEIMATKSNHPSVRLAAAKTVLEFSIKAVELEDMEQRLTALERQMSENQSQD